ncbi:MAG: hypothetical protein ABSG13_30565 [Bryobacteraceae bacterium]|jgi:hypothetical protein
MGEARRTRSVGTKLTEEEYAKLEALAAQRGVTPGECVRDLVLGAFGESKPEATLTEQALLSELLALRTILINTVYDLASGEDMTPERMEKLIAKADAGKLDRALERLKETTAPRSGGSNPR